MCNLIFQALYNRSTNLCSMQAPQMACTNQRMKWCKTAPWGLKPGPAVQQERFPGAHNATDYPQWVTASELYPINSSTITRSVQFQLAREHVCSSKHHELMPICCLCCCGEGMYSAD